jgi:hypothetical protein
MLNALAAAFVCLFAATAHAAPDPSPQPGATPAPLDKLQRADGAKVVPERFLRSWDPVTVFFDRDTGPAAGGPEDAPAASSP